MPTDDRVGSGEHQRSPGSTRLRLIRRILAGVAVILFGAGLTAWLVTDHSFVSTPSMYPTLRPGSEIFFTGADRYEVGDIVQFEANGQVWAHRLMEIKDDGVIVTKGDNPLNAPDVFVPPVTVDDITGKVSVTIPFLGFPALIIHDPSYGLAWLRTELGVGGRVAIVALVAAIAFYYAFDVRDRIRAWRRRRDPDPPRDDDDDDQPRQALSSANDPPVRE